MSGLTFDGAVDHLKTMFPDFDRDVIDTMIRINNGHLEKTVEVLLSMQSEAKPNKPLIKSGSGGSGSNNISGLDGGGGIGGDAYLANDQPGVLGGAAAAAAAATSTNISRVESQSKEAGGNTGVVLESTDAASIDGSGGSWGEGRAADSGDGGKRVGTSFPKDFQHVPGEAGQRDEQRPISSSYQYVPKFKTSAMIAQEQEDRLLAEALQNELFRQELAQHPEFRHLVSAELTPEDIARFHRGRYARRATASERRRSRQELQQREAQDMKRALELSLQEANNQNAVSSSFSSSSSSSAAAAATAAADASGGVASSSAFSDMLGGMGTALRNRLNMLALQFRSQSSDGAGDSHGMYTSLDDAPEEDARERSSSSYQPPKPSMVMGLEQEDGEAEMIELTSPVTAETQNANQGTQKRNVFDIRRGSNGLSKGFMNSVSGIAASASTTSSGKTNYYSEQQEALLGKTDDSGKTNSGGARRKSSGFWSSLTGAAKKPDVANNEVSVRTIAFHSLYFPIRLPNFVSCLLSLTISTYLSTHLSIQLIVYFIYLFIYLSTVSIYLSIYPYYLFRNKCIHLFYVRTYPIYSILFVYKNYSSYLFASLPVLNVYNLTNTHIIFT